MRKVESPSGYDLSERSLMAYRTYASLYLDCADEAILYGAISTTRAFRTLSFMTVMVEPSWWQSAEGFPAITVYIGERRISPKPISADISSTSNDDIVKMVYRMVYRICMEYMSTHGDRYADIGSDAAILDMISDENAAKEWQYNIHIERAARLLSAEHKIPMQNAVKIWELIADLEQGMRENGISHAILSGNWERHMEIIENVLGGKQ